MKRAAWMMKPLADTLCAAVRSGTVVTMILLVGCGIAPWTAPRGPNDVDIPPIAVPMARMPGGPIPAALDLPHGKGPFPAVIILHGCGGLGASQLIWSKRLIGWGYATLIPDSLTPRGVDRVCDPDAQPLVTPRDRVGDIGSAIAWLRSKRGIDPDRIAVLGLSHGGDAAVLATQRMYQWFGLRAAIDYYGPCVDSAEHGNVPLLVLVGGADDWGDPAERCAHYGQIARPDEVFEMWTYPGVHHAFDNPLMPLTVSDGHVMEYNEAAAEDSFLRVRAFLDRWLRPLPPVAKPSSKHVKPANNTFAR